MAKFMWNYTIPLLLVSLDGPEIEVSDRALTLSDVYLDEFVCYWENDRVLCVK